MAFNTSPGDDSPETVSAKHGAEDESQDSAHINVGTAERVVSVVAGATLAGYGLARRSWPGAALALAGGLCIYRGARGWCSLYQLLGINNAQRSREDIESRLSKGGVKIEKVITVQAPADVLYREWRDLQRLPEHLRHIKSVEPRDDRVSHWVASGPLGSTYEWDAEIINERENELIAWRSLEDSEVDHAGSVRFKEARGNGGTDVHLSLKYNPRTGPAGIWLAKVLGQDPESDIDEDLHRFKQHMEAGEVAAGRR
jgi:uncharacterized membrane protein